MLFDIGFHGDKTWNCSFVMKHAEWQAYLLTAGSVVVCAVCTCPKLLWLSLLTSCVRIMQDKETGVEQFLRVPSRGVQLFSRPRSSTGRVRERRC